MKMLKYVPILFLVLIGCTSTDSSEGSVDNTIVTDPSLLGEGRNIAGSLQENKVDKYSVDFDEGTFVYGEVNQISVDVEVEVFDPNGKKVVSFDGPGVGTEPFFFDTELTGTYQIEVSPFEEDSGEYTIVLRKIEPTATIPEQRVDQLMSPYDGDGVPGGVVGVIKDGKVQFAKGYGLANLTHNLPFSVETPTNIGSVSKQFTAFGIILLEQQGKLSLDDDVRDHIPELPDFGEVITIKNLMNHTNGLREIYNTMPITGWKGEDDLLREEAITLVQRQPTLQASPGSEYNYNNTAFIFLSMIIERISGETFPDWMKENVFLPLGMNNTMARANPAEIVPGGSQGYSNGDNGYKESGDLYAASGAGTVYTTVGDFAKWLNNFKNPVLGGKEAIEKLTTPGILNNGDTMKYALGIGVGNYRGLKRFQHGGADIAHRAFLAYYPEIDAGVVTLSNNASFTSGSIANKVAEAFFNDEMEPEVVEVEDENEVKVDIEILEAYVGKYKAESIGLVIEYEVEDQSLVAKPQGQSSRALIAKSDSLFDYEGIEATVVFLKNSDGEVEEAVHSQGGSDVILRRLPPYDPEPTTLMDFEGKYYSNELETAYEIKLVEDHLIAKHRNMEDINLSPVEENNFNGSIYFLREVVFERNSMGAVIAFKVSNGRTKGVLFEKQ